MLGIPAGGAALGMLGTASSVPAAWETGDWAALSLPLGDSLARRSRPLNPENKMTANHKTHDHLQPPAPFHRKNDGREDRAQARAAVRRERKLAPPSARAWDDEVWPSRIWRVYNRNSQTSNRFYRRGRQNCHAIGLLGCFWDGQGGGLAALVGALRFKAP